MFLIIIMVLSRMIPIGNPFLKAALNDNASFTCNEPKCTCTNSTDTVFNEVNVYNVTCYITSLSSSDDTFASLSSDIKLLNLICSDANAQSQLTTGMFDHVTHIRSLSIAKCNITFAHDSAFDKMVELRMLTFIDCQFRELPENLWANLPELSYLSVTNSGLRTFPSLCGLRRLEVLNASHQEIQSMDRPVDMCDAGNVFQDLRIIDLSNNILDALPRKLLQKAPHLQELYIGYNHLNSISLGEDTPLNELKVFDAAGQKLNTTEYLDTLLSRRLGVFRVTGNGNTLFPLERLEGCENLTVLYLENFLVNDSIWNFLPHLTNLKNLSLAHNNITSISLPNTTHLHHLNLTGNQIMNLDDTMFSFQRDLISLDLSWNNISKLYSYTFANLTSLKFLHLQHNKVNFLYMNCFSMLFSLVNLYLNNNQLTSLPFTALDDMGVLEGLDVSYNKLSFLPRFQNKPKLVLVNVNYNELTNILRSQFSGLDSLEYLFYRHNKLQTVDLSVFSNTVNLLALDLRECQLNRIVMDSNHPSLAWINLDNNELENIDWVFVGFLALKSLLLSSNYLTKLTSRMFPPYLEYLFVDNNNLMYIEPQLFWRFPFLKGVDLSNNLLLPRLDMIQVSVPSTVIPNPTFSLENNSFVCDCEMGYLKAWADHRETYPAIMTYLPDFKLDGLYCKLLKSNQSVPFNSVPLSDFICPYRHNGCFQNCSCCPQSTIAVNESIPDCKCLLTCPDECTCYQGGSELVKFYAHVACSKRNLKDIPADIPSRATHVWLDGNELSTLRNGSLNHVTDAILLYLNHSDIEVIQDGIFENLDKLERLDLSNNFITRVDEKTFGKMASLVTLYLNNNLIQFIHSKAFSGLEALKGLYLNLNQIKSMNSFAYFPSVTSLTLADNMWTCDCNFTKYFLEFIRPNIKFIDDFYSLRCFWFENSTLQQVLPSTSSVSQLIVRTSVEPRNELNDMSLHSTLTSDEPQNKLNGISLRSTLTSDEPQNKLNGISLRSTLMSQFNYDTFCPDIRIISVLEAHFTPGTAHITAIVVVVVVATVIVVVGSLMVWRLREVQALMYAKFGIRLWDHSTTLDRQEKLGEITGDRDGHPQRTYDAFISYSHLDEDFVVNVLAPRLESQGPRHYKLCLHYRDFPVGASIADTIMESVAASKRTILLLSENFVASEWCRFEFRTAHHHVLREGGHRLIVIMLGPVAEEYMDPDLKVALKTRTYLRVDDRWFWEKLYFALPDVEQEKPRIGAREIIGGKEMHQITHTHCDDNTEEWHFTHLQIGGVMGGTDNEEVHLNVNIPQTDGLMGGTDNEEVHLNVNIPQTDGLKEGTDNEEVHLNVNIPQTDGLKEGTDNEEVHLNVNIPQTDGLIEGIDRKEQQQYVNPQDDIRLEGIDSKEQQQYVNPQDDIRLEGNDTQDVSQNENPRSGTDR